MISVEVVGTSIEVAYAGGTKQEISNGIYERKNAANRTIIERDAKVSDTQRLNSLANGGMPTPGSDDTLRGDLADDLVRGGDGDDNARGDGGNDTLQGGKGVDTYDGGLGIDVFVFARDVSLYKIADFGTGADVIDLSAYGIASIDALLDLASERRGDTFLNFGTGDVLLIDDVRLADLKASDFIL